MGESAAHIKLVCLLADWISNSLLDGNSGLLLIDHPDTLPNNKPPMVSGFIPDILVPHALGYHFIIGEAKTADDLEKDHSREQIKAFLCKCEEYEKSFFILAVPWYMVRLGKTIVGELLIEIKAKRVEVNILEKLSIY